MNRKARYIRTTWSKTSATSHETRKRAATEELTWNVFKKLGLGRVTATRRGYSIRGHADLPGTHSGRPREAESRRKNKLCPQRYRAALSRAPRAFRLFRRRRKRRDRKRDHFSVGKCHFPVYTASVPGDRSFERSRGKREENLSARSAIFQ